jgi:hypothetical protein
MSLIPDVLMARLIANGSTPEQDHLPLVKLFYPLSAATWLLSEINPYDKDTLFGLGDLGVGSPELGSISLAELEAIESRGARILRDGNFVGRHPLSVYAEAARERGAITTIPTLLDAAAERLRHRRNNGGGP